VDLLRREGWSLRDEDATGLAVVPTVGIPQCVAFGIAILLARASSPVQQPFIGNQAGGRVFLFLSTDDFWRDYNQMLAKGIKFIREPVDQPYGTVAVFEDLYGNLWDLVEHKADSHFSQH